MIVLETQAIINSVISLFIMILVGVYSSKKKIITPAMNKGLTDILIKIALPFMILTSFMFTFDDNIKSNIIKTLFYSLAAYIIVIFISYLLLIPVKGDKKTILHFANVFTNTGYVGFPILFSIYGPEGVIYGSIFNMFFVIFVWTYGLLLFKGKLEKEDLRNEVKNIILNPSIIAVFLGIIILVFNIQLPQALFSSMNSIGSMTGPLSMIILLLFFLIGDMSKAAITVMIMVAMPASAMTSIFAESFNKENEYAAIMVSATTLLSLITVPMLLKIIFLIL